jgi:adenine-specific DNA methylase
VTTIDITIEKQRKLGKFETPEPIAEFISRWAIRKGDDLVLEPCIGAGVLFFKAIQQLEEFQVSNRTSKNIYGVDIDFTAVENVKARLELGQRESSNLVCMDFLKTTPNIDIHLVDVVICNPPYTRHQDLEQNYKSEIAEGIEKNTSIRLSRQSSIYVYFVIHAAQFLKENGRMAFVLPTNFLEVNYGVALRRFLVENFRVVAIILFPEGRLQFPTVLTTTCIVLLEKQKHEKDTTIFLKLNLPVDPQKLVEATENPSSFSTEAWVTVNKVHQASLNPTHKWNRYSYPHIRNDRRLGILRDIARVKRGIATGANNFFTLSEDKVRKFEIERKFLKPILKGARNAPFLDFAMKDFQELKQNGKRVWLLSSDQKKDELHGTSFLRYIELGEKEGLHHRCLTSSRQIWYSSEKRVPSPIIFTYMNRNRPRFILNKARILVLNTFHFLYPEQKTIQSNVELKALLAYLNSNKTLSLLSSIGRIYGGGLLKVEPRELERLPVMNFLELEKSDTKELSKLFDQLCVCVRNGHGEREIRKEIDQIVD